MNVETQAFIRQHGGEDVKKLALMAGKFPQVDMPYALQQIAGWQTARKKLPAWAAVEGMVYPPHISMEQCSSERTARYKMAVIRRLVYGHPSVFADFTGGFGVDFSYLARCFDRAVYVEQQEHLCRTARHNFRLLGLEHAEVVHGDAAEQLHQASRFSVVFLDPARRNGHGGKTFAIADCTPDVAAMRPELTAKAEWVMLKLSPMLDWHKAMADLGGETVREVHIVSAGNECKELLMVLSERHHEPLHIFCANDDSVFAYDAQETVPPQPCAERIETGMSLYEPNASIMKAGCFEMLSKRLGVKAIAPNSHLFVSPHFIGHFPGRKFRISAISSMNRHELKEKLGGVSQANVAVRNFPMDVVDLRKRLKLKDGGSQFVFATTASNGRHVLLLCEKW